jgi:ketosteroid isomerase-like protein
MTTHTTPKPTTITDPKVDVLNAIYAAFGRGDVDAILAPLADDVDWAAAPGSTAAPWYGEYHGKRDVPRFFQALGTTVDVIEFTPMSFTTNDTDVIVAIRWGYRVRATNRTTSAIMYHWWRFADGKIAMVRTLEDTHQAANAFNP